jgi:hypothetical protein
VEKSLVNCPISESAVQGHAELFQPHPHEADTDIFPVVVEQRVRSLAVVHVACGESPTDLLGGAERGIESVIPLRIVEAEVGGRSESRNDLAGGGVIGLGALRRADAVRTRSQKQRWAPFGLSDDEQGGQWVEFPEHRVELHPQLEPLQDPVVGREAPARRSTSVSTYRAENIQSA